MKKVIIPFALLAIMATSCSKNDLLTPNATTAADNSRLDDRGGDDHGGGSNGRGGGGQRISAASVPYAVKNAFNSRYYGATGIEWKKLDNGTYKVEFYWRGVRIQTIFSASGAVLKEERSR